MRLSRKYPVPRELALLYEFVNSLDLRGFVHHGELHATGDELATVGQLESWMRRRGLLGEGVPLDAEAHRRALALRTGLRALLQRPPGERGDPAAAALVNAAAANLPLVVRVSDNGEVQLEPRRGAPLGGLGRVLVELQRAAEAGRLGRLKTCAAEECRWVFYDRSRPATRRWCTPAICGNREKTRAYRRRLREAPCRVSAARKSPGVTNRTPS